MRRSLLFSGMGVASHFALALPALASTLSLPDASYFGESEVTCTPCNPASAYGSRTTPGRDHTSISSRRTGTLYESNYDYLGTAPYVKATTQVDTTADTKLNFSGSSYANIEYYFEVLGPSNELVPVNVFSRGFVESSGFGQASASVTVQGAGIDIERSIQTSDNSPNQFISLNSAFSFETDTYYSVDISARVSANGYLYYPGKGFSEAYVDPVFTIEGADAKGLSLAFSPGIENQVSSIPLPASARLFGAALIALGAVGCGSKRKSKMAGFVSGLRRT